MLHYVTSVSEPPAKKEKKIPKILDGKFYTITANNDGKIDAKCNECGEIKKGHLGSTGNFKSHYKKHKNRIDDLDKYLKEVIVTHLDDADQIKSTTVATYSV